MTSVRRKPCTVLRLARSSALHPSVRRRARATKDCPLRPSEADTECTCRTLIRRHRAPSSRWCTSGTCRRGDKRGYTQEKEKERETKSKRANEANSFFLAEQRCGRAEQRCGRAEQRCGRSLTNGGRRCSAPVKPKRRLGLVEQFIGYGCTPDFLGECRVLVHFNKNKINA